MEPLDICLDVYPEGECYAPPPGYQSLDLRAARGNELALAFKQWEIGQELRIRFENGTPALHGRVAGHAAKWLHHANLKFNFAKHSTAEIRVTFLGVGYWSYIGTDALKIPSNKPTMRLGGFHEGMDEVEMRRTVVHEFGHAIGCVHEQASPAVDIPWDEEKVLEYYKEWQGWTEETTRHNVLHRYGKDEVQFTGHDPKSIMQYPVPNDLTKGNFEIGWNTKLSDMDKDFIGRMYPKEEKSGT